MLTNASAAFSQTSNTSWTLAKTGVVNATDSTVTWTITGTQVSTISGHLMVDGFMTVANTGAAGAPIGNIVVNLQTKNGSTWVTRSSDVADATHGDAATTAHIDPHGVIRAYAGTGEKGFSGDGGLADKARLNNPSGLALDSDGNLYISDFVTNRVRRVDALTHIITTVAGNGRPARVDAIM